jgi:predicted RNase H-like HicB family nuclease
MKNFMAVIQKDFDTGLYVGFIPGIQGAHSQGVTLDDLNLNLKEVLEMLAEDGDLHEDGQFVGTQLVAVA